MNSQCPVLDAESALPYLGKTVLVELAWEQDPESLWCCMHIVGIVLPLAGIQEEPYFLVKHVAGDEPFPNEMFWSNVRTIRVMRYRDRHGSGNVLGRVTHPDDSRSRAALPDRRNSPTVPSNGSTGGANP
ncbi:MULTISPECIES: hypothetical protein [Pseudomonas]|uniref:hypothetical protein n=1 Tax=Pseudomonas TaxID=286 RepID=UPI000B5B229A|nr:MULTISPECIES: hypothetical protein [Pseudomonas]MBD9633517.1 hypothetical protein [Pseudomonas sp. PDM19]MBT9310076.1 hypothetical protein [Pseudomonas aeruginosa]MCF8573983.1 hypothetical protein [Pseudomonas aeruginosa]MCG7140081.1 hypothetical protein [Pseudomonas aeruginosa]MCG7145418.1 hypothetical protein [Pseudomonas aeruginosa]